MSGDSAAAETRRYGRSAGLLTIALGSAGLLIYAFFSLASHTLDRDAYGEIVVLWSIVFVVGATLFRPIEQLLSRSLAEHEQLAEPTGHVVRVAAGIQLALTVLAVVLLLALKSPIEEKLLSGGDVLFWVLVCALIGFGARLLRARLPGRATPVRLLRGAAADREHRAAGIRARGRDRDRLRRGLRRPRDRGRPVRRPGGDAAGDASPPRQRDPGDRSRRVGPPGAEPEFSLSHGGAFAAAVLLIMLSEQIIISSGALFVRAAEGAAAAGFIFNVLMVARAPLVLFQAVAASLLPHLTRLRTRGDVAGRDAFRISVNTTLTTIAGFAVLTTLAVLAVGPEAMQLAFGDKFTYDRLGLAIVAVGMGFYLSAAALNQAALAQGQVRRAALCWVVCALGFVAWNLASPLDAYRTVEVGFTAGAALLAGLLYAVYTQPHPVAGDLLEPGSPRELEARLAAADEIG